MAHALSTFLPSLPVPFHLSAKMSGSLNCSRAPSHLSRLCPPFRKSAHPTSDRTGANLEWRPRPRRPLRSERCEGLVLQGWRRRRNPGPLAQTMHGVRLQLRVPCDDGPLGQSFPPLVSVHQHELLLRISVRNRKPLPRHFGIGDRSSPQRWQHALPRPTLF